MRAISLLPFVLTMALGPAPALAGRARPVVNGVTLATEVGTPLRGTHWATDVTGRVPTLQELRRIREIGGNALHLYGENFSSGTPVGSKMALIDTIVQMTRDENLFLVLTIGNGSANGSFNYDYTMGFWNLYAPRYASEPHVIYEIQNEPHKWTPGYPAATLTMERDAYNLIRSHAPDTPVLLFSYAVFNNSGNVFTDISSLGVTVDWTKAAIAFHGYATPAATKTCLTQVLAAGYPAICTEFAEGAAPNQILNVAEALDFEDKGVSWLNFVRLDRITDDKVKGPALRNGIVWAADIGTWPVPGHPRHNLGGPPTQPFFGDYFSSGGSVIATAAAIDASAVNAAPVSVYQSARSGAFSIVEPHLVPHGRYTLRLHFAETQHSSASQRRFHVDVNGNAALVDFDIFAAAGAANRAVVRDVPAKADASGQITLSFRRGLASLPVASGIEFLPVLPSPWSTTDIGAIPAPYRGAASHANGYTVIEAAGADIFGTADSFNFVHQPISGDCEIRARVAQLEATDSWSKAGVMIRDGTAPDSRNVFLAVTTANGVALQQRASTGGASSTPARISGVTHPRWVRLVRSGDSFTGYHSGDGLTWTLVGSTTVSMGADVTAGLALTSHNPTRVADAGFDIVKVTTPTAVVGAFAQIEAENYDSHSGPGILETCVESGLDMGALTTGSSLVFSRMDFGAGAFACEARVASSAGGTITLRLDSPTGPLVGTLGVPATGGAQTWTTVTSEAPGLTGIHDLHVSFSGGPLALNWLRFLSAGSQPPIKEWRKLNFGAAWNNSQVAGDLLDPEADGTLTLLEYALLGDPLASDTPTPTLAVVGDRLALTFWRDPERTDVTLTVQGADAPGGPWVNLARSTAGRAFLPLTGGVQINETATASRRLVECSDAFSFRDPAHPQRFLRVQAQQP